MPRVEERFTHNVPSLGAGLAGLGAAGEIFRRVEGRANIGIFSKVQLLRARSMCAEGRTAAVLRAEEGDSVQLHAWDTVKGSDFLAGLNVAWQFAETSPKEILQLEHWGIPWTQDNQGRITQRPLPAAIHLGR